MYRDRRLLQEAEASRERVTLVRLYGWSRPTVSVGRHQDPSRAMDLAYCEANDIPWVRRPTGGRAVLHDQEVTYAVASNDTELFPAGSIGATYRQVAGILARGLEAAGAVVDLHRRRESREGRAASDQPCFASAARHELLFQGRKLIGSAQRRLRHSFLQHGSIPLRLDYRLQARVLRFEARRLRARVTCWEEVKAAENPSGDLAAALLRSFALHLRLLQEDAGLEVSVPAGPKRRVFEGAS